jgi:hypothetical protein
MLNDIDPFGEEKLIDGPVDEWVIPARRTDHEVPPGNPASVNVTG